MLLGGAGGCSKRHAFYELIYKEKLWIDFVPLRRVAVRPFAAATAGLRRKDFDVAALVGAGNCVASVELRRVVYAINEKRLECP